MKLTLSEKPELVSLVEKLRESSQKDVKVLLPRDSQFWSVVSLRVLEAQAKELGKELTFVAQNEKGKTLLAALHGEDLRVGASAASGGLFSRIFSWLPLFSGSKGLGIGLWKGIAVAAAALVVLVGGGIFALLYFSEATVTLSLNSSPLVKNQEVILSSTVSEADVENLIVPGIPIEVEESGNFKGETSGTKEVGSKASGEVTIYNYDTANEKEFSKGDVLVDSEGREFILSEGVEVDAATSTVDPETTRKSIEPATTSVIVEAAQIGTQSNIDDDVTLCFENLDNDLCDINEDDAVFAVTDEKFSGGDSKEVSVVTAEDQNELLEESVENLTSRCSQSLQGKLVGGQKLTGKAVESSVLGKEFSPAVGEEADEVELNLRVSCKSLAYSEEALYRVLSQKIKDLVPEGFEYLQEDAEIEILTAEESEEGIRIQVRIAVELTPKIDTEQIQEDLAGRSFSELDAYFSTQKDINSYDLRFWPPLLPNILGRFPLKKERITVRVEEM